MAKLPFHVPQIGLLPMCNSKILDVGIGTGYTYTQNCDIVKRKNLQIVGVDIDDEYVRQAKHAMIDVYLDEHVRIIKGNIYEIQLELGSFDYVLFSDSYAVIPDVHEMATFCERFLKPTGHMLIISTLFEKYNPYVNWCKERIVSLTTVDFGQMMIKGELENYIKTRNCTKDDYDFTMIHETRVPVLGPLMRTFMVKWRPPSVSSPNSVTHKQHNKNKIHK